MKACSSFRNRLHGLIMFLQVYSKRVIEALMIIHRVNETEIGRHGLKTKNTLPLSIDQKYFPDVPTSTSSNYPPTLMRAIFTSLPKYYPGSTFEARVSRCV